MKLESLTTAKYINEEELIKRPFFQKILTEDQQVQNWRGPFSASKLIEVFLCLEAKIPAEPSTKAEPTFMYTKSAQDSMGQLNGREAAQVTKKLADFVNLKKSNPLAPFGKSDKTFSSMGSLSGFRHAHLTHDISVVYKYDGKINQFCIYGVFGHAEMGTDATHPNPRKQQAMGARLNNQSC